MRTLIIAAALLCAATGCRSHKSVENTDVKITESSQIKALRKDSVLAFVDWSVDSPRITVEWLDTPRRRITVSARRVERKAGIDAATTTQVAATDTLAAAVRRHSEAESAPAGTGFSLWWRIVLAAAAAVAIGLSFARIPARR